jgi:hypothetical protein
LRLEVPAPDELTVLVEWNLAGDVDQPAPGRLDHMAVAERRRKRRRGQEALHAWSVLPNSSL